MLCTKSAHGHLAILPTELMAPGHWDPMSWAARLLGHLNLCQGHSSDPEPSDPNPEPWVTAR